jgi:hypothetical protein
MPAPVSHGGGERAAAQAKAKTIEALDGATDTDREVVWSWRTGAGAQVEMFMTSIADDGSTDRHLEKLSGKL